MIDITSVEGCQQARLKEGGIFFKVRRLQRR